MMRRIITFVTALTIGLLIVRWAGAANMNCIALTNPVTKPYYATHVCLSNVSWSPANKQFAVRLSYGYVDSIVWRETGDLHLRVENKPAVPDNLDTPQNEAVPANPAYDNATAVINSTNLKIKKLEVLILELAQAAGELAGTIVELTLP